MSSKELFKLNPIKFCLAMGLQIIAAVGEVVVAYVLTLQFDAAKNRNLSLFLTWTLIQLSSYIMVFLFYNLAGIVWQKLIQNYLHLIRQELTDHYFADSQKHAVSAVQNRMTNDLEMIKHAGIGVAMGNALPDVQKHADYVTSTVDEDGVAAALRHFGVL